VKDDDDRPWEQPGGVRRDVSPHRGNCLMLLANVAVACGLLSFLLFLPVVAAVACGGAVYRMGLYDLERMHAGTLDPRGRAETESAMHRATLAVGAGTIGAFSFIMLARLLNFLIEVLR
jgi:hypothetical protein